MNKMIKHVGSNVIDGSNVMKSALKYPMLKDAFATRLLIDGKNVDGEKGRRIASIDKAFALLEENPKATGVAKVSKQLENAINGLEKEAHVIPKNTAHSYDVRILNTAKGIELDLLIETAKLLGDETHGANINKSLKIHGETMVNFGGMFRDTDHLTKTPDVKEIIENFANGLVKRGKLLVDFVTAMGDKN